MDTLDTRQFISEIKKKKAIWDSSSKEYKDKYVKKSQWVDICTTFHANFEELDENQQVLIVKELQAKWKHLRDCYVRFLRNKQARSAEGRKYVKLYIYARQLEFLKTTIIPRKKGTYLEENDKDGEKATAAVHRRKHGLTTIGNVKGRGEATTLRRQTESSLEVDDDDDDGDDDNHAVVGISSVRNRQENHMTRVEQTPKYPPSSLNRKGPRNLKDRSENYVDNYPQDQNWSKRESRCDDMDFFRSLLPFIKVLPLYQKMQFRVDVMKLALDYSQKSRGPMTASPQYSSYNTAGSTGQQYSQDAYQEPLRKNRPKCSAVHSDIDQSFKEPENGLDQPNCISPQDLSLLLESGKEGDRAASPESYSQSSNQSHISFKSENSEQVLLEVKSEFA